MTQTTHEPRPAPAGERWTDHAEQVLSEAGHRSSGPRSAVITALGGHGCVRTARDIVDELREHGRDVGMATVYRALELLEELGLVQRLDVGEGPARYEPAMPSGEHHHHFVCDRCGRVSAFEDAGLERAIAQLARRLEQRVGAHDVILRGDCHRCAPGAG